MPHVTPFKVTSTMVLSGLSLLFAETPVKAKDFRPPLEETDPDSPSALTNRAGCPFGPPGDTSTAVSVANTAFRLTPSPLANAHVACHARKAVSVSNARLFTTVTEAWKENEFSESSSASPRSSAEYSTSKAHLAAQSCGVRTHHPLESLVGTHASGDAIPGGAPGTGSASGKSSSFFFFLKTSTGTR
tara:strand:- start:243 stop:806 length:564 start_codon:yes stop_codon:yes gene_type:complete